MCVFHFYLYICSFFSAARENNGMKEYLLKWKNEDATEIKCSDEVKLKWPQLLVDFLQNRIKWNMPASLVHFENQDVNVVIEPVGVPTHIICKLTFELISIIIFSSILILKKCIYHTIFFQIQAMLTTKSCISWNLYWRIQLNTNCFLQSKPRSNFQIW